MDQQLLEWSINFSVSRGKILKADMAMFLQENLRDIVVSGLVFVVRYV